MGSPRPRARKFSQPTFDVEAFRQPLNQPLVNAAENVSVTVPAAASNVGVQLIDADRL